MTLTQRFWDLTRQLAEPPTDPFELRQHLLDAHNQDPETVPSDEQLTGLQALHGRLHQAGADHQHQGLVNGSGVTPFVAGGVKSSGYVEQFRCKRCGRLLDRSEFSGFFDLAAEQGRLSCVDCLEDARIR